MAMHAVEGLKNLMLVNKNWGFYIFMRYLCPCMQDTLCSLIMKMIFKV